MGFALNSCRRSRRGPNYLSLSLTVMGARRAQEEPQEANEKDDEEENEERANKVGAEDLTVSRT